MKPYEIIIPKDLNEGDRFVWKMSLKDGKSYPIADKDHASNVLDQLNKTWADVEKVEAIRL